VPKSNLTASQQTVADSLGVLEDLARGLRASVQPRTYEAFAEVLGLSVPQLKRNVAARKRVGR
jgi:hypothetical protein